MQYNKDIEIDFDVFPASLELVKQIGEDITEDRAFRFASQRLSERLEKSGHLVKSGAEYGAGPTLGLAETGAFTPLVVQDISLRVTSEAYRDNQLVAIRDMPVIPIGSPLHEEITVQEYGDVDIDVFFAESGSPSVETGKYARKPVQARFLGVKRVVSDVATVTNIAGDGVVTKSALERETRLGIPSLNLKRELATWTARKSLSPLHFDGIIEQIKLGGGFVRDLGGGKLSLTDMIKDATSIAGRPGFGLLEKINIPDEMYGALVQEATTSGRFKQDLVQPFDLLQNQAALKNRAGELILTPAGLTIIGSYGQPVLLRPATFQNQQAEPPAVTTAVGDGSPAVLLATLVTGAPQVGAHSSSLFTATSAGTYRYIVVAYGDKGRTAHIASGDVVVGAGDRVKFDWADAAIGLTGGAGSLRYYALFRSEKDKTTGFKRIDNFGRNTDGASSGTLFYDTNSLLPGGVNVTGLTYADNAIYMATLLPTIRRPLASTETSQPFLMMTFEAPKVNHEKKQLLYQNCDPSL